MLRVLTYNVWNLSGPWRERRVEIVAWLERVDADIVCLQEVVDDGDRNSARWLASAAGYEHVGFDGEAPEGRADVKFGNAVLSRWPIENVRAHRLPNEPGPTDIQRQLLHARTNGIDVFTTHLTSLYQSGLLREKQVVAIDELIEKEADPASGLPPILAGDFNAEPDSTEMRFLAGTTSLAGRSTYFQDAWRVAGGRGPGSTWDNRNTFAAKDNEADRRIDYIFVGWRRDDGLGRVESARVVGDRTLTGTQGSDHYGLLAEIAS